MHAPQSALTRTNARIHVHASLRTHYHLPNKSKDYKPAFRKVSLDTLYTRVTYNRAIMQMPNATAQCSFIPSSSISSK